MTTTTPTTTTTTGPVFAQLLTTAPSNASRVYRPPHHETGRVVRESLAVLDAELSRATHWYEKPRAWTGAWPAPAIIATLIAGAGAVFFDASLLTATAISGAGVACTGLMRLVDPFFQRRKDANATPLLEPERRERVVQLNHASTSFEPTEGGTFESPEVDAALATRARYWLDQCKQKGVVDKQTLAMLEDLAKRDIPLSDADQERLDLTLKIMGELENSGTARVLEMFNGLSDEQKREIAPYIREHAFTPDGLKVHGDKILELHAAIEAVDPTLPPHTIKVGPTLVGGVKPDLVATLETLAEFDDLYKKINNNSNAFEQRGPAFAYAKDDKRTAIERVLIGIMAERMIAEHERQREPEFRTRHALAELVAIGKAQPDAVRVEGKEITKRVDGLSRARAMMLSHYHKVDVPGMTLRELIDMIALMHLTK